MVPARHCGYTASDMSPPSAGARRPFGGIAPRKAAERREHGTRRGTRQSGSCGVTGFREAHGHPRMIRDADSARPCAARAEFACRVCVSYLHRGQLSPTCAVCPWLLVLLRSSRRRISCSSHVAHMQRLYQRALFDFRPDGCEKVGCSVGSGEGGKGGKREVAASTQQTELATDTGDAHATAGSQPMPGAPLAAFARYQAP